MSSSRNTGIDTLRGIGVLVVVMVHAGISGTLLRGALVIAVPLFYLAAGYTCKDTGTLRGLVTCKFRRLIVPFMFYAAAVWRFTLRATACCCTSRCNGICSIYCRLTGLTCPTPPRYGSS